MGLNLKKKAQDLPQETEQKPRFKEKRNPERKAWARPQ